MTSPYAGLAQAEDWAVKTRELIEIHPLSPNEIYEVVIQVWREIFESNLTSKNYKIGVDLFPRPQIMAYFLHELIPLELRGDTQEFGVAKKLLLKKIWSVF